MTYTTAFPPFLLSDTWLQQLLAHYFLSWPLFILGVSGLLLDVARLLMMDTSHQGEGVIWHIWRMALLFIVFSDISLTVCSFARNMDWRINACSRTKFCQTLDWIGAGGLVCEKQKLYFCMVNFATEAMGISFLVEEVNQLAYPYSTLGMGSTLMCRNWCTTT
jgi:hypothetical protein